MILVLYCRNQPLGEEASLTLMGALPDDVKERLARMRFDKDRWALLLGRALLAVGLREYGCGNGISMLSRVSYSAYGRPFLSGGPEFSISHSGHYVVCALSDEGRVGIDLERVRPIDPAEFTSHLTAQERSRIEAAGDAPAELLRIWCAKESAIKADGRGLSIALEEVETSALGQAGSVVIGTSQWHQMEIGLPGDEHICSIALEKSPENIRVEQADRLLEFGTTGRDRMVLELKS